MILESPGYPVQYAMLIYLPVRMPPVKKMSIYYAGEAIIPIAGSNNIEVFLIMVCSRFNAKSVFNLFCSFIYSKSVF